MAPVPRLLSAKAPGRETEAERILNEVRLELYKYHPDVLAARIGVSASAIRSFRSGRTKWPRHITLLAILEAIGYEVIIARKGDNRYARRG